VSLRFISLRAGAVALCALLPVAAQTLSAPEILKRVSETYRNLKSIDVSAQQDVEVAAGGRSASGDSQFTFAMGEGGKYLLTMKASDRDYTMVSDGDTTWRYVPKTKQWSKEEVAAASSGGEDDDDDAQQSAEKQSHDPLTELRSIFIDRYSALDRLGAAARLDRDDRVKVAGEKIDCYKLVLSLPSGPHELLIDKQRFFVLRHTEVRKVALSGTGGVQRTTLTVKQLDTGAPPASLFTFTPPPKTSEVSMLILPGETRVDLTGRSAADFTLKDLQGTKINLSELRGKIVMLDFWATWCPPCRHELPVVAKLHENLKDKNVVIMGINDEDAGTVKNYLKKNELTLPVLMDSNGSVHKLYGAHSIPTVIIINGDGTIAAHYIGARSEEELMKGLKSAGLEL